MTHSLQLAHTSQKFHNLSKYFCPLGTKSINTWAYWGPFSIWTVTGRSLALPPPKLMACKYISGYTDHHKAFLLLPTESEPVYTCHLPVCSTSLMFHVLFPSDKMRMLRYLNGSKATVKWNSECETDVHVPRQKNAGRSSRKGKPFKGAGSLLFCDGNRVSKKEDCVLLFYGCSMSFLVYYKKGNVRETGFTLAHTLKYSPSWWGSQSSGSLSHIQVGSHHIQNQGHREMGACCRSVPFSPYTAQDLGNGPVHNEDG